MYKDELDLYRYLYNLILRRKNNDSFLHKNGNKIKVINVLKYSGLYHFIDKVELNKQEKNIFKAQATKLNRHSFIAVSEAITVSNILNKLNIKHVFLKGSALNLISKNDVSYRPISDVDVLIDKDQIHETVKLLLDEGYKFDDSFIINKKHLKIPSSYISEIQLRSKSNILIELHTKITKDEHQIKDTFENDIILHRVGLKFGNNLFYVPSDEYYLLSIIYNYVQNTLLRSGIKSLIDTEFFFQKKHIEIDNLLNLAKKYNLDNCLNIYLNCLNELEGYERFKCNRVPVSVVEDSLYCLFKNTFSDKFIHYNSNTGFLQKLKIVATEFLPRKKIIVNSLNIPNSKIQIGFFYPLFFIKKAYKLIIRTSYFKEYSFKDFNFDRMINVKNFLNSNDRTYPNK